MFWRLRRRMSDAVWAVRYRLPGHRYHIVNTGLKPGYYDVDTLMLNACMALLCRYIEDERGGEAEAVQYAAACRVPDPNAPDGLSERWANLEDEALAIYRWWKVEKPADEALNELQLMAHFGAEKQADPFCTYDEFRALEQKIADDEQKMLHRLIDIRGGLWT